MQIAVTEVRRARLSLVLYWISVTSALVLFAIGLRMILDHAGAAKAYGGPVSGIVDEAYMSATGVRNLSLLGVYCWCLHFFVTGGPWACVLCSER
jgi:hypothetical protein